MLLPQKKIEKLAEGAISSQNAFDGKASSHRFLPGRPDSTRRLDSLKSELAIRVCKLQKVFCDLFLTQNWPKGA